MMKTTMLLAATLLASVTFGETQPVVQTNNVEYSALAAARAKITQVIDNPGDMTAVMKSLSSEDQKNNAARDRKRTDSVAADELRRDFQENGLRRAWETFLDEGAWTFRPGYGAVLYDKIGRLAVGSLLGSDIRARATVDAVAACRHDYPQKYRTAPEEEIFATDVFRMHQKALLARAYFETLRDRALSIDYNPADL